MKGVNKQIIILINYCREIIHQMTKNKHILKFKILFLLKELKKINNNYSQKLPICLRNVYQIVSSISQRFKIFPNLNQINHFLFLILERNQIIPKKKIIQIKLKSLLMGVTKSINVRILFQILLQSHPHLEFNLLSLLIKNKTTKNKIKNV